MFYFTVSAGSVAVIGEESASPRLPGFEDSSGRRAVAGRLIDIRLSKSVSGLPTMGGAQDRVCGGKCLSGGFSGRLGHVVVVAHVFVGDDDDAAAGELPFVGFDYFRDVFGCENGG